MNVPRDAMIIMYSSTKLFIQQRIEMCKELGKDYKDYERDLETVEKAWSDYLKQV